MRVGAGPLAGLRRGRPSAWRLGDRIRFGHDGNACFLGTLDATVIEKGEARRGDARASISPAPFLDEALHAVGHMPLPPYIASKRAGRRARPCRLPDDLRPRGGRGRRADRRPAFHAGAVRQRSTRAASSAHFVTLHVGAGTFLPVKADDTADHKMHAESGHVSAETAERAQRRAGARQPRRRGRHDLAAAARKRGRRRTARSRPGRGATDIFITPGYRFRAVDVLMTNFHLPRSTLFMLVSAFAGLETMRAAYAHAIDAGYRFYSYGDASLLLPERSRRHDRDLRLPAARHRRQGAARRDRHAARHDPHAGLHAGRHRRHGQGDVYGPGARRSAPTSSSATPII